MNKDITFTKGFVDHGNIVCIMFGTWRGHEMAVMPEFGGGRDMEVLLDGKPTDDMWFNEDGWATMIEAANDLLADYGERATPHDFGTYDIDTDEVYRMTKDMKP